ncbi:protein cortex isoform X1 [Nasonia vitripennis]|uniref:Protein cortex n=1 Tax=Nasonia vitripennis TaxID=7425 RepID=A0A7M7H310_NASVI|nr:protein cortex isoform X1 [Nasonia vitripennis]
MRSIEMHRLVVENNLRRDYDVEIRGNSEAVSTPLRGNLLAPPRRVLDFEPVSHRTNHYHERTFDASLSIGLCTRLINPASVQSAATSTGFTSSQINVLKNVVRDEHSSRQLAHAGLHSYNGNIGDRFIPRRRGVNVDAAHYLHTRTEKYKENDGHYLDVFEEVQNATEHWRREYMQNAFGRLNIFEGLGNKRVLNIGREPSLAGAYRRLAIQEFVDEGQWPCRPRKQPLMSMRGENSKRYRDHGAQIFRFAMSIKAQNVIDWSAKDTLAAGMSNALCVCDVDSKSYLSKVYRIDHVSDLCCVKWNAQGTQVSMSGVDGHTSLYDTVSSKIAWTIKCPCNAPRCIVASTVWANSDKHMITGCNNGYLNIIDTSSGRSVMVKEFECEIRAIAVSVKDKYLVLSGTDRLVKLFEYPSMEPLFEIAFFTTIKAFAWHPWRSGILCIGGGPGDGALSLWNVSTQTQLSYKKVDFVGSVDSMMFNKLSGELLVHWFYLANDKLRSKIVILAALNRVVDAVPIQPEHKMLNIIWGPDHTKLAMHHRDTLVIWDFFGNDDKNWSKYRRTDRGKTKTVTGDSSGLLRMADFTNAHSSLADARRGKSLGYYCIR